MTKGEGPTSRAVAASIRRRFYAGLLTVFVVLFALRVAAQGVQRWTPQPFLPPFDDFQGSPLPYGVLLASQLFILAAIAHYTLRLRAGTLRPSRLAGAVLAWLGGTYMVVSLGRIAIGLTVPGAGPWFSAWVPATLHVVLAAFVVTLAYYHVVESTDPLAGGKR